MKKRLLLAVSLITCIIVVPGFLLYNGYIWFNNPSNEEFPYRGLDVSNHQGVIDWRKVESQNFSFVYIKATEGKDYIDKFFKDNWINSKQAGLRTGAYHFFTFGSKGIEQAMNFINIVPNDNDSLPPVIDVEFGGNSKDIPDREQLKNELKVFIEQIQSNYNRIPIIYVTYEAYSMYIQDDFKECKIWIRDIFKYPQLKDNREWAIWQYCNRGRVEGIDGFVDLNVFSNEEWAEIVQ
ncbi:MAG: Lysozyme M1 precursor [Firmicutes bacterium ADurb.Bin419]|nr:MAG: Lysozyme M1 precursor [Firmicutes bacterium ADurb.Bin419]